MIRSRNAPVILGTIILTIALGGQTAVSADLSATATAAETKFCLGTPLGIIPETRMLAVDAISLSMRVSVSYRNTGANPLILLRDGNLRLVLSQTREDALRRRRQTVVPYYEFFPIRASQPEDLTFFDADRPEGEFQVIPPGGTWTDEPVDLSFQVHKPSADGTGAELVGKKVYLQIELDQRLLPAVIKRRLRGEWRAFGNLWADVIRTQPIELDIPISPEAAPCPSNERI